MRKLEDGKLSLVQLQIKPLTVEQLPEIVDLDRNCFGGLWSLQSYQKEIDNPNSTLLVLTIPSGKQSFTSISVENFPTEKIIGIGCYWAILEEAHITMLAVQPDYQSKGLGQFLLYNLLLDAANRNLERTTLEVREFNLIALSLYEKFGFKRAGIRKGYYQKTGENAVILWRSGLATPEFMDTLNHWKEIITTRLEKSYFKFVS